MIDRSDGPDLVVTVPKDRWADWITEGDNAGDAWTGDTYEFTVAGATPPSTSRRLYIVAWGRVRGYAPILRVETVDYRVHSIIRGGGAVAVTIPGAVWGFRGWRYRWWTPDRERPFPDWQTAGMLRGMRVGGVLQR